MVSPLFEAVSLTVLSRGVTPFVVYLKDPKSIGIAPASDRFIDQAGRHLSWHQA